MAQQDAVVKGNQRNMQEQGGFRTYIGRKNVRLKGATDRDIPARSGWRMPSKATESRIAQVTRIL